MPMKDSYRHLYQKSRAHLEKGEVGLAIHALQEALQLEPDDTFIWEEIFKLCMLAGSTRNALVAAFELRRIDGNNPNYVYMHGIASLTDGQVEAAAEILEDALRRVPRALEVRRALAQSYEILDKPERMRELLEEGVEQSPTEPAVVNDLAVYLLQQGEEGKRRAEPLLRRVLKVHPGDEATHLNLALVLAERDAPAARQHAQRALRSQEESIREQAQQLLTMLGGA
jgi:predicted Zn-dependent protease